MIEVLSLTPEHLENLNGIHAAQANFSLTPAQQGIGENTRFLGTLNYMENIVADSKRRIEEISSKGRLFPWNKEEIIVLTDRIASAQSYLETHSF